MRTRTRILVISDTHGMEFDLRDKPCKSADVAIHCGDLSDESKLEEFRGAIRLLNDMDAPFKIVVAGNHDFTMDNEEFARKVADASPPLDPELVAMEYGTPGEARKLFEDSTSAGITFLDEGTHHFTLASGAQLTVYASPFTPALGAWGFQYHPDKGHNFDIADDVDIVVTHGPPKGIMDFTHGRERAGCPDLFAAVARARPLVHCFGHIHEGWGAKLVAWRDHYGEQPSHFTAIDNNNSYVVENLSTLAPSRFDTAEDVEQKAMKMEKYRQDRCCSSSHCAEDTFSIKKGEQTLFINASVAGDDGRISQKPWLIDIDLLTATAEDA